MNIQTPGSCDPAGADVKQPGFIDTSFRPPPGPANWIERRGLGERLNDYLAHRVILVRGGPGFGKTTLLAQWWAALEDVADSLIWLSLDEEDEDAACFLGRFAQACAAAGIDLGTMAADAGSLSAPAPKIMEAFARGLSQNHGRIVVFLDDYHFAQGSGLDGFVDALLKHSDDRVRLIVATRTKPGFAAAALRASGQLVDVTESDLAFSRDEAAALLRDVLDAADIRMLADKTEGWPAVLQLANIWVRSQPDAPYLLKAFSGGMDSVSSYLIEQVLGGLPVDVQTFLLKTSILRFVNGDLADMVCGRTDSWQYLERLAAMGALVVPVGRKKQWYRYHPILAGFLRKQLPLRFEADEVAQLHIKASLWWKDNKQPRQAAYHAWCVKDVDQLLAIVDSAPAVECWRIESIASFDRLVKDLPKQVIDQSPRLQSFYAFYLMKRGRPREAAEVLNKIDESRSDAYFIACLLKVYLDQPVSETYLSELEALAEDLEDPNLFSPLFCGILNNALTMLHFRMGNFSRAAHASDAADVYYKRAGSTFGRTFILMHSGMYKSMHGHLGLALEDYQSAEALRRSTMPWDRGIEALIEVFCSEMLFEQGGLEAAGTMIDRALPVVASGEAWPEVLAIGFRVTSALAFIQHGLPAALEALSNASEVAQARDYSRTELWIQARRVYLAAAEGQPALACRLAAEADLVSHVGSRKNRPGYRWYESLVARLALCRVELSRGQPDLALSYLSPLNSEWVRESGGWLVTRSLLLHAMAYHAKDNIERAALCMEQLLRLSHKERQKAVLLEEIAAGETLIKATFSHVDPQLRTEEMIGWMAELLSVGTRYRGVGVHGDQSGTLSEREAEVLREMRSGDTYKVIAGRLGVSEDGVKSHLRRVYRKLKVADRRLAVAIADKRGLLRPAP